MNQLLQVSSKCCDIMPVGNSHGVFVDGIQWARHDSLVRAESLRAAIVERWAAYYEAQAAEVAL